MDELERTLAELGTVEASPQDKARLVSVVPLIKENRVQEARVVLQEMDHQDLAGLRKLIRSLLHLLDRMENDHQNAEHSGYYKEGATREAVVIQRGPRPFSESVAIAEAEPDSEGDVWNVRIIKGGINTSGTRFYTPQSLQDIATQMAASQVQCFVDHPSSSQARDLPERGIRELLGWYTDPQVQGSEVKAKFHLLRTGPCADVAAAIREAWQRGNPNLVGISIRGVGDNEIVREGTRIYERVNGVTDLISADAVTRPGAHGKLIGLAESENESLRRFYMDLATMSAADILKARPDLVGIVKAEAKDGYTPPEDDKEMGKGTKDCKDPNCKDPNCPVHGKDAKKEAHMKEGEVKESAPTVALIEEAKRTLAEAQALAEQARKDRCAAKLEASLAQAQLPQALADRVRKDLGSKVFTDQELTESLTDARSLWDQIKPQADREFNPSQASITTDEKERFVKRLDATVLGDAIDGHQPFRSFREARWNYRLLFLGAPRVQEAWDFHREAALILQEARTYRTPETPRTYKGTLQESQGTSTSWSVALGDSTHRIFLKLYDESPYDLSPLVSRDFVASDVKQLKFSRRGGYTVTPSVNEGGTYQEATFPAEAAPTLDFTKYGHTQPLTIEAIINDDMGALQAIPRELSQAARFNKFKICFDLLANNSNTWDAVALAVTAGHANYSTTAISGVALLTAIRLMRSQTNAGSTDRPISLKPKTLMVPNELDDVAWRLTNANYQVLGADYTNASVVAGYDATGPNIIKGKYGLQPLVVDYWTDPNNWWLVADPKKSETMAAAHYPSKEPELTVQDDPTEGSVFTADAITYKVRYWFGAAVLDYRPFVGNVVS